MCKNLKKGTDSSSTGLPTGCPPGEGHKTLPEGLRGGKCRARRGRKVLNMGLWGL